MGYSDQFFKALGVDPSSQREIREVSKRSDISVEKLKYYNNKNIIPSGKDLTKIESKLKTSEIALMIKMGRLDHRVLEAIQSHSDQILEILGDYCPEDTREADPELPKPALETHLGQLYNADCLTVLRSMESDSVDLVFADPPFNLDKLYPSNMNDNLREEQYLKWSEDWMKECIRVLKPGGSFFTWNLPIWNSKISAFLHSRLSFRHWIASDMKLSLPLKGKLYPSHYSLLYFVKGLKPNTFSADRLPTPTCPKCYGDIKDYGGYKHKMNPAGISLTDVWYDIPAVRHAKYKKRKGANELSVRLLDRVIEMASKEGDLVFDPFGGSGTTYAVSEIKGRRWIGCEIGPCEAIQERFKMLSEDREHLESIRSQLNHLFTPGVSLEREKRGIWTAASIARQRTLFDL